jgi:hypothetical protein
MGAGDETDPGQRSFIISATLSSTERRKVSIRTSGFHGSKPRCSICVQVGGISGDPSGTQKMAGFARGAAQLANHQAPPIFSIPHPISHTDLSNLCLKFEAAGVTER